MEKPKNSNNPPISRPAAEESKNIPTVAGALIILIVAVITGSGLFYIFQYDLSENYYQNAAIPKKSVKSTTEAINTKENEIVTPAQREAEKKITQSAEEEAFDFDYELKKLDDQNNSVSSDDFNENELSDTNVGL